MEKRHGLGSREWESHEGKFWRNRKKVAGEIKRVKIEDHSYCG